MDRSDVFISYRRADVEFTKRLYEKLKDTDRAVWIDWENIPPGVEGFTDEIRRGIEGTDTFICVLSPGYLESEYCIMELREALKLKKRVIPIVVKKFDPLPPPEGIGHINWVYFTPHAGQRNRFDDSFPKVIKALEADYEHVREHTRLLLRAIDWEKNEKNNSYLLKDAEIGKAERWQVAAIGKNPPPTELQGEYILASRAYQRKYQRRLTAVFGILMVFAVLAAIFAGVQWRSADRSEKIAIVERNNAKAQEATAKAERALAEIAEATAVAAKNDADVQRKKAETEAQNALISGLAAQSQLTQSRQLGILLALEAYKESEKKREFNPAVQTSLRTALVDFSGLPVHPYQSEGLFVQFSPDDRWLISLAEGGHVKISDMEQGLDTEPVTLAEGGLSNIVVSPDSEWVAGVFIDDLTFAQKIQVWELKKLEAGPQTLDLPQDAAFILTLAFGSNEGRRYWLTAGLEDGSIYRWNVADLPSSTAVLFNNRDRFERPLTAMAFSPDGTWLAAAFNFSEGGIGSRGPLLALWNLADGGEPQLVDLIDSPVDYLEFSGSGKWLAGGSEDRFKIRLWNMTISSTVPAPQPLTVNGINDIAFSPDERWMAVAQDTRAEVFNLRNFSGMVLPGYKDVVLAVGFNHNGRVLATGDYDGRVHLWNTADFSNLLLEESQARIYNGFDVIVRSLDFNSDGSRLAAAGDEQVRVWNFPETISAPVLASTTFSTQNLENAVIVQTGENRLVVMDLTGDEPATIIQTEQKFPISYWPSPDERYLAVTNDKQIEIWDLQNPDAPLFDLERQQGKFVSPTFTADSDWFVYAVEDRIFALDLGGQKSKNPIELLGNRRGSVVSEFFTVDHWLISRSTSEVLAWDTSTSLSTTTRLSRSSDSSFVYFPSDKSTWIFVQQRGAVLAWDTTNLVVGPIAASGDYNLVAQNRWLLTTSENIQRLWDLSQPASPVAEFTYSGFSPSEKWLYYFEEDGTLHLLDLKSASPKPVTLGNFPGAYSLISTDDQWLAVVSETGDPGVLYKLTANMQKFELPSGYAAFSFSPDGKWLALTSIEDGSVLLYDLTNDLTEVKVPSDYYPVIFSPDGHWLILQDTDQRTALFNLQTRELFQKTYPPTYSVELSPDGRWLVGDLQENNRTNALLVDLNDPQKSFTLRGHTDQISKKYFTPDEHSLLTYGFDGTIRIWNLENPAGDPVVLNHDSRVSEVSFSENGQWLISNTPQGIYIWQWSIEDVRNLACRLAGRNLTEDEWAKYMGATPYEETCEQWPP